MGPAGVGIPLIENVSSIILEYRASPDTPRTLPSPYFDGEEGSAIGLRSSSGLRVHLQADWEVKIACFVAVEVSPDLGGPSPAISHFAPWRPKGKIGRGREEGDNIKIYLLT